ncbi:T6SS immunity protein Tdi1 domain-containing protein [Pedobacter panaciterrae]
MNNILNFQLVRKPGPDEIAKFQSLLPANLLQLWQDDGFGSIAEGYLKVVNPDDFEELLKETYSPVFKNPIVMFATGMGDLIIWENDYTVLLNHRYGVSKVIESGFRYFLDDVQDKEFIDDELKGGNYLKAKDLLGDIAFDECYGYVPLLGIGGSEKVENLQKVKIKEHISLIAQTMGKID